jgi:mRNA-degrading endonuclease RelE of RelBE toxin-antitoxin system
MFEIALTKRARGDLQFCKKSEQKEVLDGLEAQLADSPPQQTRNRKPLRPNDLSGWEVRIGPFRAFYDVDEDAGKVVVKAIGRKEHNKLFIRGKEYQL